jgi:hypothetical protein
MANSGLTLDLAACHQQLHGYISLSLLLLDPNDYPDAVNPSGIATSYRNTVFPHGA